MLSGNPIGYNIGALQMEELSVFLKSYPFSRGVSDSLGFQVLYTDGTPEPAVGYFTVTLKAGQKL